MGILSGFLVVVNVIPYGIRVYQRKIHPVPTSWILWSFIGLALLLTYRSSGARANVWPALFGFTNPTLITILSVWRHEKWEKPEWYHWLCLVFGIGSLATWWFVRQREDLAQYALYLAIVADLCAAIPSLVLFKQEPEKDRPFAWFVFGAGWFVAIFAITEQTFANYALPVYMMVGSFISTCLLVYPRIKGRVPIKEWI
jgi:Na+/melibiose symporter-like transporter